MQETENKADQIRNEKLIRHRRIYKLIANWETDVCLGQLMEMGPYQKREQKIYELTLFNLLNNVIKRSYQEGRKNAFLESESLS